jgi:hypothetical protein
MNRNAARSRLVPAEEISPERASLNLSTCDELIASSGNFPKKAISGFEATL